MGLGWANSGRTLRRLVFNKFDSSKMNFKRKIRFRKKGKKYYKTNKNVKTHMEFFLKIKFLLLIKLRFIYCTLCRIQTNQGIYGI